MCRFPRSAVRDYISGRPAKYVVVLWRPTCLVKDFMKGGYMFCVRPFLFDHSKDWLFLVFFLMDCLLK